MSSEPGSQIIKKLDYTLASVKAVVEKWLYIEDESMLDVMLAGHLANQLPSDPLWLIFIAPPSHTKTELLRAFDGYDQAYLISNLTPSTLVSGLKPKSNTPDPSLIYKIDGKTLILKDFTTVLSMRSENQHEILSQLREVYDGQYTKAFGNGKVINWNGKVGFLAACTPVYDKHYGVIGTLGDRFLLYRSEIKDNRKMGMQAQKMVGQEERMREEIKNSVHKFLDHFKNLDWGNVVFQHDESVNKMIVDLASFSAYARCPVDRDYRDQCIKYDPSPEGPARLVKQFMLIGKGLALVHGKTIIDAEIYEIVKKIGQDLVSTQRLKVLRYLWQAEAFESTEETKTTREISEAISYPSRTVSLITEDLKILGLLRSTQDADHETAPKKWQITEKALDMMRGAKVFQKPQDDQT